MQKQSLKKVENSVSRELRESIFLKACRLEKTAYTPVWLMRQAGRYMKEYRDIREKTDFLTLCKNKELTTEITVSAQEKINADAAIIFSDILLVLEPLGAGLRYSKHDGPVIETPIRDFKQIEKLKEVNTKESLPFLFESIRLTRRALRPHIPLIGFGGAPFTLASYLIEGGASKDFSKTKALMSSDPKAWNMLMQKVSCAISDLLNAQVDAGVQAVQLFDSWVGHLTPDEYQQFVLPYSKQVIQSISGKVPLIHFGTGTSKFLELLRDAGGEIIGVDSHIDLASAWERIGYDRGIQGNLDPKDLFLPVKEIKKKVKMILDQADRRAGHIFNLGHGVLPETPVEHVIRLIEMVHEMSAQHE